MNQEMSAEYGKIKKRLRVPRAGIYGYVASGASLLLAAGFIYAVFIIDNDLDFYSDDLLHLYDVTYYALAAPAALVAFFVTGTGFWIGWTILTIKVVPPMPELVEKKDYSKIKASFLCLFTLACAVLMIYGLFVRSFWAIAIPAAAITLIILGAVFWVGVAIITARSTLPEDKK